MEPQKNPTPDQAQKVVELRNVREISRAAKYIEEELEAHLQLGTADTESKKLVLTSLLAVIKSIGIGEANHELATSVDEVLAVLTELDQAVADLFAGSQAHIAEFATEVEELRAGANASSPIITLAEIDTEIDRRIKASEIFRDKQTQFEDENDGFKERLFVVNQLFEIKPSNVLKVEKRDLEVKLSALESTIATIKEKSLENDQKIQLLIGYKNAVKLVGQGPPQEIIGEKLFDFQKK